MSALWSYLLITVCLLYQLRADDISPDGEAQCTKPSIDNVDNISTDRDTYHKGEEVTVRCNPGYYPSSNTMTCDNPPEWTPPTITCTAQCKEPSIDNVYRVFMGKVYSPSTDKEYYKKGELVTVQCNPGYYPSPDTMRCTNPPRWTPLTVTCKALCRKPDEKILKMDPNRRFYNIDETVTVTCPIGYQNPNPSVKCVKSGSSIRWNNPPQCIALCARPSIPNMEGISVYKEYYKKGEWITVKCKSGYYQSSPIMTCNNPRTPQEWTPPTITCIAQCKKPSIDNVDSLSKDQEYYYNGDLVRVQCIDGYYPSSYTMTCNNPPEWTPPTITCIGVTFTDWRVTATSISVRISCTPQCPDGWIFIVRCCPEPYFGSCKHSSGRSVTFTDLRPSSNYRIYTRLHIDRERYSLKSEVIITKDSVPGQPEILNVPSMEDNTIRWELSEKWGKISEFQMNISVRRDYNHSFSVDESLQFPPNVTEYKIPLQYGTKYTITLRGFTSAGALEATEWITETEIGDPPRHPENTLREGSTLLLYPVSDVNGPISSYEIIVYMDQDEDLGSNCIQYSNTSYNSNGNLSHYTAAVLPAETLNMPRTFILGDNHHYNGFHNVPLIPNINYTVYIRVTSRREKVEKSSCAFAGFIGALTTERTDGFFIIVLSLPSLGLIITMLILKVLALVGLAVIPLTPWMGMGNPAEKRGKKRRNISTEDVDDDEAYEVLEEAENRI